MNSKTCSTYVMIRVSSPGSPRTPSTKRGIDVKLYLLQDLPSSKLNLMTEEEKKINYSPQISKGKIKILSKERYYQPGENPFGKCLRHCQSEP